MSITIQGKTFERIDGFTDWKEWVATEHSECPADAVGKQTKVILERHVISGGECPPSEGWDWYWKPTGGGSNTILAYCTKLDECEQPTETEVAPTVDVVNHPPHYQLLPGVEVIDVLDALCKKIDASNTALSSNQVSYYTQAVGYLMRFMDKNGKQDLEKASWYLKRMLDKWEE